MMIKPRARPRACRGAPMTKGVSPLTEPLELIAAMPKIDLHLHLDGCVRPETLIRLARERNRPLPEAEPELLLPYMQVDPGNKNLTEYLSKFDFVLPHLQDSEALELVAFECVKQTAASGGVYVEVRFAPMLHTREGLSAEDAVRAVISGLKRGESECGIPARAIVCCMRHFDDDLNLKTIEAASRFAGHGLGSVDLAGDESRWPTSAFRRVFEAAAALGLPATIHAGEADGPGSIREAVERLGAVRIGHGVRAQEDAGVIELLRERGIALEMCPTSNIQTRAVSGWDAYPLRRYAAEGLVVTANTDNPTVSGTTIADEYRLLHEKLGMTPREIAALVLNAADAAFLEPEAKSALISRVRAALADLGLDPGRPTA